MKVRNLNEVLDINTSKYLVSDIGDVYSINTDGTKRKLRQTVSKRGKGYLYVSISDCGRVRKYYVHQLVAKAFLTNSNQKTEVNHRDCNTMNNHVENLEWVNHSENVKHAWGSGMMNHRVCNPHVGESSVTAKLTESQVLDIRLKYKVGSTSYRKLAAEYGVGNSAIQSIIERKTWKHI